MAATPGFADAFDLSSAVGGQTPFLLGDRPPVLPSADQFSRAQWMNAPDTTDPGQMQWNARVEPGYSVFDPTAPLAGLRTDLYAAAEADLNRLTTPGFDADRAVANRHDAPMNGRYMLHLTCQLRPDQDPWPLQTALFTGPGVTAAYVHAGNPLSEVESLQTLNLRLAREALDNVTFLSKYEKARDHPAEYLRAVAHEFTFVGFLAELTRSPDETVAELATTIWGHTQLTSSFVARRDRATDSAPKATSMCGFVFGLVKASTVNQMYFNFGVSGRMPRIAQLPLSRAGSGDMLVPHVRALASRPGKPAPLYSDISDMFETTTAAGDPLPFYWVSACQAKTDFDPSQVKLAKTSNYSSANSVQPKYGEYNYVHVQACAFPEAILDDK